MKFRTLLLGAAALFVAFNAAFFSVTGLSKLFAGSAFAVILMASSLEFAKLIAASFLHNYWKKIGILLKTYLTIGVVVLILITSGGIYGFLTSAYQATADKLEIVDKEAGLIQLKVDRFQEQLDLLVDERNNLSESATDLSRGLSNNVVQYKDEESGQIITSTSSSNRRALETQLKDANSRRDLVSTQIEALTDSVTRLEVQILEIQSSNEDLAGEVGPLKFMAEATGKSMNTIVNWFALFIIFVFDPLAVTLVIAFNTAIKIDRGEKDKKKIIEKRKLYGETSDSDDEFATWDTTIQDGLDDVSSYYSERNENIVETDDKEHQKELISQIMKADEESGLYEIDNTDGEDARDLVEDNLDKFMEDLKHIDESTPILKIGEGIPEEVSIEETPKKETNRKTRENKKTVVKEKINKAREDYENGGWRNSYKGQPYYMHPWFDWKRTDRWINDRRATQYWLNSKGGSATTLNKYKNNYPTDFDSKTY